MNVSIGLDYSSFCNHYYAEAEKMADITVAGYVKKYGPLSRYIDAELVKDMGISYALEKVYCEYDSEHESKAGIWTFMSRVVHNCVLSEMKREQWAVGGDLRDSSFDFSPDPEDENEREKDNLCDYLNSAADSEAKEKLIAEVLSCMKRLKPIDQVIVSCWMTCPKGQYTDMALSELNMEDNARNRETVQRRCCRAIEGLKKKMEEKSEFALGEIFCIYTPSDRITLSFENAGCDSKSKDEVEIPRASRKEKLLHYRSFPVMDPIDRQEQSRRRSAAEQSITGRIDYDQLSRTLMGMSAGL
ncbi:MAG: hypothetical protein SOY98_05600 [Candidatus Cryptobacteroides sp.]|nr:hypothetical protein [Candidatus Cryptobacteroides sp.]